MVYITLCIFFYLISTIHLGIYTGLVPWRSYIRASLINGTDSYPVTPINPLGGPLKSHWIKCGTTPGEALLKMEVCSKKHRKAKKNMFEQKYV